MQYPVIYAGFLHLNHCNSISHIMLAWLMLKKESQNIDDLPGLATCQSGTSAMLSGEVNAPIVHGSARLCLIWFMEAFD